MKAKMINETVATTSHLGFGYFDKVGREIGMKTFVWEVDVVEADASAVWYRTGFDQAGHYFAATTHATRNGAVYGASQSAHYFKAREDRDLYLARRWADSLKAAQKKAAA